MKTVLVLATAIAAVPFPVMAEGAPDRCAQLRRQLEIVDAQLAKRSSQLLDERHRVIVEEMATLKCADEAAPPASPSASPEPKS